MSKTIILFIFLPGYEIRAVYDPGPRPHGFRLLVRQSLFVDMDAAPGSRMRVVPCSRGKTAA